jgi:hypothetical protein
MAKVLLKDLTKRFDEVVIVNNIYSLDIQYGLRNVIMPLQSQVL